MDNITKTIIMAVILIGLYFTSNAASPIKSSTPHLLCDKTMEDQNLPYPSDCSRYYRCVYSRKVPKICPEKMLFNPTIGNCDLHYNVECPIRTENDIIRDERTIENLTGRSFVKNKYESNVFEENNNAESVSFTTNRKALETSTAKFVYVPHATIERAYYKVENGEKFLLYCEENMIFNFEIEVCARPWDFK